MKTPEEIQAALLRPFPSADLEWRVGREVRKGAGVHLLAYITARAVMARMDEVFGPAGWDSELREVGGGMLCRLTARWPDGTTVVREDVAQQSDIEGLKGSASGALKRAAVGFGIGRYLYEVGDTYADLEEQRPPVPHEWHKGKYWRIPALPACFLPDGEAPRPQPARAKANGKPKDDKAPVARAIASCFAQAGLSMQNPEHGDRIASLLHDHFGVTKWSELRDLTSAALTNGAVGLADALGSDLEIKS